MNPVKRSLQKIILSILIHALEYLDISFHRSDRRFQFMAGHTNKKIFVLLLQFHILNISAGTNPLLNMTSFVVKGHSTAKLPPVLTIKPSKPVLHGKIFSGSHSFFPMLYGSAYFIRMNYF